jgi:hypothetical protein
MKLLKQAVSLLQLLCCTADTLLMLSQVHCISYSYSMSLSYYPTAASTYPLLPLTLALVYINILLLLQTILYSICIYVYPVGS